MLIRTITCGIAESSGSEGNNRINERPPSPQYHLAAPLPAAAAGVASAFLFGLSEATFLAGVEDDDEDEAGAAVSNRALRACNHQR